jgi:MOSC domain-containing protein YiiM
MKQIKSVNIGKAQPLKAEGKRFMSAIGKHTCTGTVAVGKFGLYGDEQVETPRHGGVKKAIYAYPIEHYATWESARKNQGVSLFDDPLPAGFMGENLTISGINENAIWIGESFEVQAGRRSITIAQAIRALRINLPQL